jgi:hypothetical protein
MVLLRVRPFLVRKVVLRHGVRRLCYMLHYSFMKLTNYMEQSPSSEAKTLLKNFLHFMELEGSLPYSQESATCP